MIEESDMIQQFGPPPPPEPRLIPDPASHRAVAVAAGAALVAAVAATPAWHAIGTAIVLVLPVAAGLLQRDHDRWWTRWLLIAAAVPLAVLPLRTGPESLPLVGATWLGLLAIAATTGRGAPPWTLGPLAVVQRLFEAVIHLVCAPAWVRSLAGRGLHGRVHRLRGVVRGLLVAVPLVWVLAALLASADQVFASALSLPVPEGFGVRVTLAVGTAWTCLAVGRGLATTPLPVPDGIRRWLGTTEVVTVLLPLVGVFALFAAAQAVAALGGAEHVLDQAGLTYAAYARQGFFQLVAVAVITLAALTSIAVSVRHGPNGRPARVVRWLGLAAIALVLVIVGVALRRLDLYASEYGLTRLRLWSTIGTIGIGGIFVLLAGRWAGMQRGTAWLLPAVVAWAVVLSTVAMAAGPDAVIARTNVGLALSGERPLDLHHISRLSDDAVPPVLDALPDLLAEGVVGPDQLDMLRIDWCDRPAVQSWAGWNLARAQADAAREGFCQ